ncbi:MAG TPA: S53 family peptidase [Acidimicrobiales bacterium]|nr:S53 family peptidase [Acidimicrobiales bacterium]
MPPKEQIHVSVILRRSSTRLTQHLERLYAAERPDSHPLSREQFARRYGARPADIALIRRFARTNGLFVAKVRKDQRIVELTGTADAMSAAFGVRLSLYRSPRMIIRSHEGWIHVPPQLLPAVTAVLGFDTRPAARAHFRALPKAQAFAGFGGTGGTFTPSEIGRIYGFPTMGGGAGQTIAILEFGGGYQLKRILNYLSSEAVGPLPEIIQVSVGGGANDPTGNPNSADGEVQLDIEVAASIATQAKFVVYFAPNTNHGYLAALKEAVHDRVHRPNIISISWGAAESSWAGQDIRAISDTLADGVALGITCFVAAGDSGSSDGVRGGGVHVDFPASCPHAIACGGTRVRTRHGSITRETVWNDQYGASGGGVSKKFPVPPFQSAIVPRVAPPARYHGRGVPDIAGNADPLTGYRISVDGRRMVVAGTSAVAPLYAALFALVQQHLGATVAPLNASLYESKVASTFRDVVRGNNGAYAATPGWDACSGIGSPDGNTLLNALRLLTSGSTAQPVGAGSGLLQRESP